MLIVLKKIYVVFNVFWGHLKKLILTYRIKHSKCLLHLAQFNKLGKS